MCSGSIRPGHPQPVADELVPPRRETSAVTRGRIGTGERP